MKIATAKEIIERYFVSQGSKNSVEDSTHYGKDCLLIRLGSGAGGFKIDPAYYTEGSLYLMLYDLIYKRGS